MLMPNSMSGEDRDQCGHTLPAVGVTIAGGELHEFAPDQFDGLTVHELLRFLAAVNDRTDLTVDGQPVGDAFTAFLAAMVGPEDLHAHARTLQAAITAAAMFHPTVPEAAGQRINERLIERGASKLNTAHLVRQIRDAVGEDTEDDEDVDALGAADAFLEHSNKQAGVADNELALAFYVGEFYRWTAPCWRREDDTVFKAQVTKFLDENGFAKVTRRFVDDVLLHLQGATLVAPHDISPPFFITTRAPLNVQRCMYIAFENGLVDLNALLEQEI